MYSVHLCRLPAVFMSIYTLMDFYVMLGTLETVECIIFRNKMCTRATIILSEYIKSSLFHSFTVTQSLRTEQSAHQTSGKNLESVFTT